MVGDIYNDFEEFVEDLISKGLSIGRITSYVYKLVKIREVSEKNLEEFDKAEVRKVINYFQLKANSGDLSQNTVREVKKTLKKFFKWLKKEDLVNWFSLGKVETNLSPGDLITLGGISKDA